MKHVKTASLSEGGSRRKLGLLVMNGWCGFSHHNN